MKFFKTHSDHELKRIKKTVKQILELQPEYAQLSDEQLKSKTEEFKQRLKEESLNDLLPEAYAAIREADKRVLGMEPFPVQIMGGIIMSQGRVAEMCTGAGIDTRALTKILREKGTMNGMITTNENYHLDEIIPKLKAYNTGKVVEKVTCSEKSVLKGEGFKVALLDLGAKNNIARSLNERGCEVTIYPALTTAEEILAANPDGIMLSNGPGDPKECVSIIKEIKKLYDSNVPIFAICLGHQLMALATGADTHKMKYGHRGGNHPVKDLATGRVYISSQNHGYVVDTDTLDPNVAVPAFVNVNDGTNEGLKYVGKNIFTVQFHPEACPGPQDSGYLFDRFLEMMGGNK